MTPKSVYNLLFRKGIDATVRTYPSSSFDSDTNKTTLGSAIDYAVKIVPPYKYLKEGYKTITLITYGRGMTGIANYNVLTGGSLAFTIKAGLKIIINSKEWTVIGVTPIQDNTGILYYTLEIESGN